MKPKTDPVRPPQYPEVWLLFQSKLTANYLFPYIRPRLPFTTFSCEAKACVSTLVEDAQHEEKDYSLNLSHEYSYEYEYFEERVKYQILKFWIAKCRAFTQQYRR